MKAIRYGIRYEYWMRDNSWESFSLIIRIGQRGRREVRREGGGEERLGGGRSCCASVLAAAAAERRSNGDDRDELRGWAAGRKEE